jgi:hypothetical protein
MPLSRVVFTPVDGNSYITYMFAEQKFQSAWSNPNVPVLVFADNTLPGFSVQPHAGPIGSAMPVQLLFWGDWWHSAEGAAKRVMIESRVQAVLNSDYFSELKQYGVERPHYRGSLIVTKPGPPGAFNSLEDRKAVPNLIDDLIDDKRFPDPDDENIAFVVYMPKGFIENTNANGSHTYDFNAELPLDYDYYWVAWIRSFGDIPGEDPEDTIRSTSHELVELFTDPEGTGWRAGNADQGEIGDAAMSGTTKQAAWVNGARVQAYWSNQYGATVIPIDRDYAARITGTTRVEKQTRRDGTFTPDPKDSHLCDLVPDCCIEKKNYWYFVSNRDEIVHLNVETTRYRQPVIAWKVADTPVTNDVVLSLDVLGGTFDGHIPRFLPQTVQVRCTVVGTELSLETVGTECNFDLQVGCTVTDGSIDGNVKINVIAKPSVAIGFVGTALTMDPEYTNQKKACEKAAKAKIGSAAGKLPQGKPKFGDPVQFGSEVEGEIPAYARLHEYKRAKNAIDLARLAYGTLPHETARLLTNSLISNVPALQAAIAVRAENERNTKAPPKVAPKHKDVQEGN